jgi:hypothetical protein
MNEERTGKCLRQMEHISGHLWHGYSIPVNQVVVATVRLSNWCRVTLSLVLYICLVDRCLTLCTFTFGHCVVLRYTDSDCPFSVFLWVNCKKSKPVQLENYTQYNLYGSKIEKKIGSMNGLSHFFYILELKPQGFGASEKRKKKQLYNTTRGRTHLLLFF